MGEDTQQSASPKLRVDLRHRVGALDIDVSFTLYSPWTVLFGPSGSGKSTILRAIAGLIRPDTGRIGSRDRRIPFAPQSPCLFPHWNVADNLTMRRKRVGHADTEEVLSLFRLGHLREKLPSAISGGEAQRVNVARAAIWTVPGGLLLLDEPFTGMDVALRDEIIRDMRVWLAKREVCVLSVTHDVAEAFQLGAEVIKIAEGRVVAQGPVEAVLAEERERLLRQLQAGRISNTEILDALRGPE